MKRPVFTEYPINSRHIFPRRLFDGYHLYSRNMDIVLRVDLCIFNLWHPIVTTTLLLSGPLTRLAPQPPPRTLYFHSTASTTTTRGLTVVPICQVGPPSIAHVATVLRAVSARQARQWPIIYVPSEHKINDGEYWQHFYIRSN